MNEYKPSDLEYTTTDQSFQTNDTMGASTDNNAKHNKFVRVIITFVILITVTIGTYKTLNYYSARKARISEEQKAAAQATANAVLPQKQIVTQSLPNANNNAQISQESIAAIKDQAGQIQSQLTDTVSKISADHDKLSSLDNMVSRIQSNVDIISKNIEQLNEITQQTFSEVQSLKALQAKPKKRVFRPPVAYHIRAIVPGRAWLESENGKSITVKTGDKIVGYGTVELISPKQGAVLMSNGSVIQYGINDF